MACNIEQEIGVGSGTDTGHKVIQGIAVVAAGGADDGEIVVCRGHVRRVLAHGFSENFGGLQVAVPRAVEIAERIVREAQVIVIEARFVAFRTGVFYVLTPVFTSRDSRPAESKYSIVLTQSLGSPGSLEAFPEFGEARTVPSAVKERRFFPFDKMTS